MMVKNHNFDLSIIFIDPKVHLQLISNDALLNEFPLDDLKVKPLFVVLLDRGRSMKDTAGETNKIYIELSTKLIEKRIPTYPTIARAANAAGKMVNYYKKQRADLTQ